MRWSYSKLLMVCNSWLIISQGYVFKIRVVSSKTSDDVYVIILNLI